MLNIDQIIINYKNSWFNYLLMQNKKDEIKITLETTYTFSYNQASFLQQN